MQNSEIFIKGARTHNLKNVDVRIPRNRLAVVTGVSGSGKSSLVFDTLYAEGHRRYVESLSSYARQFLARLPKPDVEYIQNISPAIAVEQRVFAGNPRSTVGSITEVYDYLRLLFARVGRTFSPISGLEVTSDTVTDVVDFILQSGPGSRAYIVTLFNVPDDRTLQKELELTLQKGFTRLLINNEIVEVEDILDNIPPEYEKVRKYLLIDRIILPEQPDDDLAYRIADGVQTAYNEGHGVCNVWLNESEMRVFSEKFERDGMIFEPPAEPLFNFNNPMGACPKCEGVGKVEGYEEELIVPDKFLSVRNGAIQPWMGEFRDALSDFLSMGKKIGFPLDTPYHELPPEWKKVLWEGDSDYPTLEGINAFFKKYEPQTRRAQYRILVARYRGMATCPECDGTRLKRQARCVKVGGYDIGKLLSVSIRELKSIFEHIPLTETEKIIARRILTEINNRLEYLNEVGVGYLNLSRRASTLSGGETQRIRLAVSLGSNLTGSLYILDEPSIGLHPRDGENLIRVLEKLRNLGNTVVVVEHDEAMMKRADYLVDMGPAAGEHGGEVVYQGDYAGLLAQENSITGKYLSGLIKTTVPETRRTPEKWIKVLGALENNLKNIDVAFPLGVLTVVTGVSGSGKTTLIKKILYPALANTYAYAEEKPGIFRGLSGDITSIKKVEMVDQNAVGKNLRSNPVTYIGAFDGIRDLFAARDEAKAKSLRAAYFSYNVFGGRCETCEGEGSVVIQMQFLPDVRLTCEVCKGKRYKDFILEIKYKGYSISDVLNLTITEALTVFSASPKVSSRLKILEEVGLGYVRLGQGTNTLSGGELQRLKLAVFLNSREYEKTPTFFIFDEPTTGLHFYDVDRLMGVFQLLVSQGHTVLIIEHNLEVIKCADWLIDLGPEGGDEGGQLLFAGTPEQMVETCDSYTAQFLKEKLLEKAAVR